MSNPCTDLAKQIMRGLSNYDYKRSEIVYIVHSFMFSHFP
jgi:hypothetical protein